MIWRRFTLSLTDDAEVTLRVRATMLAPAGAVPMRLQPPATVPIVPARVAGDLQRYVELPG
jgi:hypothetical protein